MFPSGDIEMPPQLLGERFPHNHQWELEHLFFWLLRTDVDAATYHLAIRIECDKPKGLANFIKESYEGYHVLSACWD